MSIAALKKHALSLPGATQDVKWGADWVASVGGKMFMVTADKPTASTGLSFKVDEHRFLELTSLPGVIPAPYLARVKWVMVKDLKALPLAEIKALVARSHELVLQRLPKKLQRDITG